MNFDEVMTLSLVTMETDLNDAFSNNAFSNNAIVIELQKNKGQGRWDIKVKAVRLGPPSPDRWLLRIFK